MITNSLNRLIIAILLMSVFSLLVNGQGTISLPSGKNLAVVATPTSSSRSSASMTSLNDGLIPNNTSGMRSGGNRPPQRPTAQLVQYEWTQPVSTREIAVFWWNYENTVRLPQAYRIKYWDGNDFVPVKNAVGLGLENNLFNITKFDQVMTTKLRLEVDSVDRFLGTMLEWMVIQAENSPNHPPVVTAGVDRSVMLGGKTYLSGGVKSVAPYDKIVWSKVSGPGNVNFADANSLKTTATFSLTGDYILSMTAKEGNLSSSSTLKLKVQQPPQAERLDVVYTKRYKIDSPFWNNRAKAMIVNWIPWCINQINRTDLTLGEGGLDNFIEAGKALRGEPHGKHLGYVFSNAWVHQTIEAMSIALMVDPQDDKEIIAAQEKMKTTIGKWIPIILAAQEPDGYLQTAYTLRDTTRWKERWAPRTRGNHEGYVAGYFIESAINHYTLTEGKDKRLYDAAKKLADCWVANIGPGKKEWYDGHQEMEQALVRFGRFVNDMEGNGRGDNYINLSKFLLNCRRDGSEYDQSNVPVQQQYEAVGHAVRAVYSYSAMADVAAETGDIDYQSAVMSLWENMVNKKYYITGGVGSGETSEGFGPNYSLRNNAYCESCSSCGLIFFQYKMNIAYNDAKYADLYEETIYNALLGSLDLEGKNFYYTNGLSTSQSRYSWHVCPCCIGNIPRTLLMIPTWTYVKSNEGLYVNLFIGSTLKVEKVAETDIEMIQKTDYPWSGEVSITVNPKQTKEFTLFVRVPNRTTSSLYTPTPAISGLKSLTVNGKTITPKIVNGYAVIKRTWKAGDKVNLVLPMGIQTITADGKIEAVRGRVALRYGPMIYNVEKADQPDIDKYISTGPLTLEWRGDLLNGVMTIKGKWDDGAPLLAIPNYARNNRNSIHSTDKPGPENKDGGSIVWIKKQF
ncbi:MAG: glycoside hydrolase family 127 protein [Bacteroidales bacterium]|nr:glycoside hydrolase family 127 protein [Bacteroidales bacterium]